MNAHNTVIDLPAIAIPLPADAHGFFTAFGVARLIHAANGLRVAMIPGDDLLTAISELLFIPLDRFKKTLQSPRRSVKPQGNGLGRLAVHVRQLAIHINSQQTPGLAPAETIGKRRQKQSQLPAQRPNLL